VRESARARASERASERGGGGCRSRRDKGALFLCVRESVCVMCVFCVLCVCVCERERESVCVRACVRACERVHMYAQVVKGQENHFSNA
jgi:hypothetical protein